MKAKDMIKILEKNPEAEVITRTHNSMEMRNSLVDAGEPYTGRYRKVLKRFTDAFDHEDYEEEVYEEVLGNDPDGVTCIEI